MPKEKINYKEHDELNKEKFPEDTSVASATECTGLMPSPPLNNAEMEAYNELSSMAVSKGETEEKNRAENELYRKVEEANSINGIL
jgi:hypothetical protein